MSTVLGRPIHDLKVKLDRRNLQDVSTDIPQEAGHLKGSGM